MEYQTVFELNEIAKLPYYDTAGMFFGLFLIALSVFVGSLGGAAHPIRIFSVISGIFLVVFLYAAIQTTVTTYEINREIYGKYRNGNVDIVEGTVQDCLTVPFYKEGRGSFSVEGIVFDYGHTTRIPGYRGKGNYINTNGQQVRIHYVWYANEPIIVKLEIKTP